MAPARWPSVTVALGLAGCGAAGGHRVVTPANHDGSLAGVIRQADTGAAVDDALVVVGRAHALVPVLAPTDGTGAYTITALAPGRYQVRVFRRTRTLADQQVMILSGQVTGLDLTVGAGATPGAAGATFGAESDVASNAALWRYRPTGADPRTGAVEGTVTEQGERTRLGGAVITIADRAGTLIANAVSDDSGRFRCDSLAPGTYVVSAYYVLLGRGQFEIRRSDVTIAGGDVVVVPLAIETRGG